MTLTRRIYGLFERNYSKFKPSKVITIVTLFLSIFLTFNVLNTYAMTIEEVMNPKIDIQSEYKTQSDLSCATSGDCGPNIHSSKGNDAIAGLLTVTQAVVGAEMFADEEALESKNIPFIARKGILGYTDEGIRAMMMNQPRVNIPDHMAKQWVPGYDSTVRSTIAAEDGYDLLVSIGIDGLWEKTRLIAYVLFVVILMSAGFMIMFRQKIGGQMMVTVFNTLPGVVVGLVVVTFSFAIVGLVLNLSAVLVSVIANFIDPSGQSLMSINGPFSLLSPKNIMGLFLEDSPARGLFLGGGALTTALTGAVASIFQAGITTGVIVAFGLAGLVFVLFIAFIVLTASVKVFITVMTAYVGIILDTVLAPLYIAASTLPGKSYVGFDWFKRVLRNGLTFPLVFFFINLGGYILKSDISFVLPSGLVGDTGGPVDSALNVGIGVLMKGVLTLILFFVAAESPKFLLDILPTNGGKGAEGVIQGTKASLAGIPIVGGFFK